MTRRWLTGIVLVSALGFAACGSDGDDAKSTATTSPAASATSVATDVGAAPTSATALDEGAATTTPAHDEAAATTAAPAADAYPITISHHFGETVIPAAPKRVVSLGYTEQDAIVAFGIEPIAARYAFGPDDDVFFPWAYAAAGASDPVILARAEVNIEQIAELQPDLIMAITAGLPEDEYDLLSAIAPVVVQPEGYLDFGTPWQIQTLQTGKAFGQQAEAEAMIAEVEAEIAAARVAHPEFEGLTVAVSGPTYSGEYPFHSSEDPRGRFFTDLGFVVPQELDDLAGDQFYGTLSMEEASMLDTDVLAFQAGSPDEKSAIEADTILAGLPVVKDGRSIFIEGSDYDAFQFVSVLSLPYLLENFVPKLADVAAKAA